MRELLRRIAGVTAVALAFAVAAGAVVSERQADEFERKVVRINEPRSPSGGSRRTPVTEDELNSWFTYRSHSHLPDGITRPQVTFLAAGRMTGQATVDLEAVGRRRASGGWLDPWSLLGGRLPIVVTGTLQARDGRASFAVESATLGGVPVPKPVLQELLTVYSRSDERPRGVSLDDAFPLPADIRAVELDRGLAVVVQ